MHEHGLCTSKASFLKRTRIADKMSALFSRVTAAHSTVRASGWVYAALILALLETSLSHHRLRYFQQELPAAEHFHFRGPSQGCKGNQGESPLEQAQGAASIHVVESTGKMSSRDAKADDSM